MKTFFTKNCSFVAAFIGGLLYALGFPLHNGFSLFFAPILGFFLFNWALDKEISLRRQLIVSVFYSLGFYQGGFYWIPFTLKEFGGLNPPLNYLLGLLFSFVIIPQVYIYVAFKRKIKHPLILALIYVLLERFVPQQFPAHLGHSFGSLTPEVYLFFASLFGAAFYSYFTSVTGLVVLEHLKTKKIQWVGYSFIALFLFCHLPFFKPTPNAEKNPQLNVRVVQPNIGNFIKLESERGNRNSLRSVLDSYFQLSTENHVTPRDLIIWPETAYPSLFFADNMKKNRDFPLPPLFKDIIAKTGAEIFIGGYDAQVIPGEGQQSDFNSALFFSRNEYLKEVYHKRKLIPFGEGLPFGPLNPMFKKIITNISYFGEGKEWTGFKTDNGIPFISAICYEILFTDFLRDFLNAQKEEAQFLINLTNDSWYGDTSEPFQHMFLAKWRALEFNITLIRSTNTGITTIFFPHGGESKRLGIGEKAYLDEDLVLEKRAATFYQKVGMFGVLIFGIVLALIDLAFKRKPFLQQIMKTDEA
jgi:apolipoprotein N-acyltransferase